MRYFSTKRKRKTNTTISKPSLEQTIKCTEHLHSTVPTLCGKCLLQNTEDTGDLIIDWIQCDKCSLWLHTACTEIRDGDIPDEYVCQFCRKQP